MDLNQQEQVDQLRNVLADQKGRINIIYWLRKKNALNQYIVDIKNVNIDLSSKRLVLDTSLQSSKIQQLIEQSINTNAVLLGTGRRIILKRRSIFLITFDL